MSGWTVPGYTETGVLGAGATGRVVAAVHDASGTEVAIKYLSPRYFRNPEFVERFRDEAALLAEIRHPNVVQLFEYVESEAGSAMVMELVPGATLHRMLHENGRMAPEAALSVMRGSLLGLAAAHQMGIVHRDYKPSNVLLNAYGVSKLADFGVAERAVLTDPVDPDATMPGGTGTPAYMAPEQWDGAPARPVTDIYAVTASFFECLTGRVPYKADTVYELEEKHRTAPIPLAEVPAQVQQLITHGLAKDPAERPQDVGMFVAEVERAAADVYGVEWEERGRQEIVVSLWPMLPLLGAGAAGALDVLGLRERGEPGTPSDGGPGGSGPEGGEWTEAPSGPRRFKLDKVKTGAIGAGVVALFLLIAAVAFAGDPKKTHQAGPPSGTTMVFTPTPGAPTGTTTSADSGAAPTAAGSSPSSPSSPSSSSSSSSSPSSPSNPGSSPGPSSAPPSKPSSQPSTPPASVPPPSTRPPSSPPQPPPSTPVVTTPPPSTPPPPPASIDTRVSVASDPPGQCIANYNVLFVVGNAPGGSVNVDYTWHLASGGTAAGGSVTLKQGTSQTYTHQEFENGTTTGDVYVTWTANGTSHTSNSVSVTITCIK